MRFKEAIKNDIDPKYYKTLAMIESSGNPNARAKTSSASGLYQFTEGTWKEYVDRAGLDYTLEDRFDPKKSREVVEYFTKNNAKYLKSKLGKEPNSGELYLSHFLGVSGASALLTADSNAKVDSVVSKGALSANRSIFYNKDGTLKKVADIKKWSNKKFGDTKEYDFYNDPQELSSEENRIETKSESYAPTQEVDMPNYALDVPPNPVQVPYLAPYGEEQDTSETSSSPILDEAISKIDRRKTDMATLQQIMKANEVQYIDPNEPADPEPNSYGYPNMQEGGEIEFTDQFREIFK